MIAKLPKVSIIGMGRVGATIAFSVLIKGLAQELQLIDRNAERALGEADDLLHASPFAHPMTISSGGLADLHGSDIVVITASVPMIDMRSRLDLGSGNDRLFRELIPRIARTCPDAVLIIVTNPLDVMTYLALQLSGFSPSRVIGTGTLVDSGRFRALVAQALGLHAEDVQAYILGEHGDTQFAVLSQARAGGRALEHSALPVEELFERAKHGGFNVLAHKGYTSYAIALATTTIIEGIVHDTRRVIPVSTLLQGYLGVSEICLSVPAVIGREGVARVVELELSEQEQELFRLSADTMKRYYAFLCEEQSRAA